MTHMAVAKGIAFTSTAGLAGVVATVDPVTTGQRLATMGVAGVLGVVAVAAILAVVYLYRDQRKDKEELLKALQDQAAANQRVADILEHCKRNER